MKSIGKILAFAIIEEEKAADFYRSMAAKSKQSGMKALFNGFAEEEELHKKKLLGYQEGRDFNVSDKKIQDLQIADYAVDIEPKPDMNYRDALLVAMKKEKAAFRLYSDLADISLDEEARELFLALAQEEAKHKLRFEVEYDEHVLTEN